MLILQNFSLLALVIEFLFIVAVAVITCNFVTKNNDAQKVPHDVKGMTCTDRAQAS